MKSIRIEPCSRNNAARRLPFSDATEIVTVDPSLTLLNKLDDAGRFQRKVEGDSRNPCLIVKIKDLDKLTRANGNIIRFVLHTGSCAGQRFDWIKFLGGELFLGKSQ